MTATNSALLEVIDGRKIREILESPGPCITIVLPPYHPGEPARSRGALLKANLQDASHQLAQRGFPKAAMRDLLAPLEHLAQDTASLTGSHWGRAIFRSPDVFYQVQLTQPAKSSLTVAGCFAIRRLLPELRAPRLFYILALTNKSVQLFRCNYQRAEAVELPAGVPTTLEEALELERPDHDLENRSAIGPSTGSMHAIRFGTESGREAEHAHLADFYKLVDRGIHKLLHEPGIPLLLAGVEEEIDAYRAISAYPNIVKEALRGSPNLSFQDAETVSQAYSILRADEFRREAETLTQAKERSAPAHDSTDTDTILRAAFEGRVHQMYLDESAERIDVFERGAYRSWGKEDLLNLAAVETIVHGGKAFELPSDLMADGAGAFAIMRF
jgi:hypothetical protein